MQTSISIYSSPIAGQFLYRAFEKYNIDSALYKILVPKPVPVNSDPGAVIIQPGGVLALEELGYSLDELYSYGQSIYGFHCFDDKGRLKWRIDSSIFDTYTAPPALVITSRKWRGVLGKIDTLEIVKHPPPIKAVIKQPSHPILIQLSEGYVQLNKLGMVWDSTNVHTGVMNAGENITLTYVIPKYNNYSIEQCLIELNRLNNLFGDRIFSCNNPIQQKWFILDPIGVNTSLSSKVLLWGGFAMQLHPLTGQVISYWAQQALWLAKHLSSHKQSFLQLKEVVLTRNCRMYRHHKHFLNYYLRTSIYHKIIYAPYTFGLRYIPFMKRQALRKLALL